MRVLCCLIVVLPANQNVSDLIESVENVFIYGERALINLKIMMLVKYLLKFIDLYFDLRFILSYLFCLLEELFPGED